MVKVGERAPLFSGMDQTGNVVSLQDFLGRKTVVLFFYPKDETPGCTKEACGFRDSSSSFAAVDAQVIGISSDSVKSHQAFASKFGLNYPLIADNKGSIRSSFKVPNGMMGMVDGRVTYVIDSTGVVRLVFDSLTGYNDHVAKALECARQFRPAPSTVFGSGPQGAGGKSGCASLFDCF
eukprot:tig00000219_g19452.t1